jgi:hypothetical protein
MLLVFERGRRQRPSSAIPRDAERRNSTEIDHDNFGDPDNFRILRCLFF